MSEFIFIEVPILCNSEDEARELQKRVSKMFILKHNFLNMLAKAYESEPRKIQNIVEAVSKHPANAIRYIGDIQNMITKYSK